MRQEEQPFRVVSFEGIASSLAPVTVVCGHYGVGKTSLSVSLAIDAVRAGYEVILSDMDVVNPYFRSSDYKAVLEDAGVGLIEPVYARSNVDGPSITNETAGAIEWARGTASAPCISGVSSGDAVSSQPAKPRLLIIDAGGDDSGATVLGRFSAAIKASDYEMLYVVNKQRGFDHSAREAVAFMREIEQASHLRCSGIVGNTHLKAETTTETVAAGLDFARQTADLAGLPLQFVTIPANLAERCADRQIEGARQEGGAPCAYAMGIYVRAPWEL